jgi:tetratricopeptide (TPR) repeat protein
LLRQEKEPDEAHALIEQDPKLKPQNAAYHGLFAAIREKQGKRELARNSLRRVVELDPENPLFRARVGSLKIFISKTRKSKTIATNTLPKSESRMRPSRVSTTEPAAAPKEPAGPYGPKERYPFLEVICHTSRHGRRLFRPGTRSDQQPT